LEVQGHPIRELQVALGAGEHLKQRATVDIDVVTSEMLTMLSALQLAGYAHIAVENVESDLVLQTQLLNCVIRNLIKPDRINSIEGVELRRRGFLGARLRDTLAARDMFWLLTRICHAEVRPHINKLGTLNGLPGAHQVYEYLPHLYDHAGSRWIRPTALTTKRIREMVKDEKCLNVTKLLLLDVIDAKRLYAKLAKLKSIPNRTKMYRLIHGDVYCGSRTYRWGLTESDRCIRCFGEETIRHLLLECPYSKEVWECLGATCNTLEDIFDSTLSTGELELRAEIIAAIVFRKKVLLPEILVKTTINAFAKGLSANRRTRQLAQGLPDRHLMFR
jgi:hypothetical protein